MMCTVICNYLTEFNKAYRGPNVTIETIVFASMLAFIAFEMIEAVSFETLKLYYGDIKGSL